MARGGFYSVNSLRGVYVLVVDEDDETRAILIAILRYCGALVRGVTSVEEAQEAMRETIPGVFVLNVRPPAEADRARKDGFDGYLEEPIDPWALCRLVAELTT